MDMVQRAVWRSCVVFTQTKLKRMFFLKKDKDKGLCAGEEFKGDFVCIFIMCQSRQIQSALITATKQPEASLASSVKYVRFFLI